MGRDEIFPIKATPPTDHQYESRSVNLPGGFSMMIWIPWEVTEGSKVRTGWPLLYWCTDCTYLYWDQKRTAKCTDKSLFFGDVLLNVLGSLMFIPLINFLSFSSADYFLEIVEILRSEAFQSSKTQNFLQPWWKYSLTIIGNPFRSGAF